MKIILNKKIQQRKKKEKKEKQKEKTRTKKSSPLGTVNIQQQITLVTLNNGLFQKKSKQGGLCSTSYSFDTFSTPPPQFLFWNNPIMDFVPTPPLFNIMNNMDEAGLSTDQD